MTAADLITPPAEDEGEPIAVDPAPNDATRYALAEAWDMLKKLDALGARAVSMIAGPRQSPAVHITLDEPGGLEAWLDAEQVRPQAFRRTFGEPFLQVRIRDCLLVWPDSHPAPDLTGDPHEAPARLA